MVEPHDHDPERRRQWLWGLASVLLLGLSVAVAILAVSGREGSPVVLLPRQTYGAVVGSLVGLVVLFVLYVARSQRQLALRQSELHWAAMREVALRERLGELLALLDTSGELAQKLDLRSMLGLAARRVLPCLEADHSAVHLIDPRHQRLESVASIGRRAGPAEPITIRPGTGVVGYVFATREALTVTAEEMRARLAAELALAGTPHSALCVPIRFEDATLGVFTVARVDGSEPFVPTHARALQALAQQCGAAIVKDFHYRRAAHEAPRAA